MEEHYDKSPKLISHKSSKFYALEPCEIGTPYVESLSSYISRLSQAHIVKPGDLLLKELLPKLKKNHLIENQGESFFRNSHSVNGMGKQVALIVDVLKIATSKKNLCELTMLKWLEVINEIRLIKKHQAWCPKCYQKWRKDGEIIYQPLIWFLKPVEICNIHNIKLEEKCSCCGKKIPVIKRNSKVGYCPYCNQWLGNDTKNYLQKRTTYFTHQKWVTRQIGDMLGHDTSSNPIYRERFLNNLMYLTSITRTRAFLRQYRKSIDYCIKNNGSMQLGNLLDLSYHLQIPVKELLFKEIKLSTSEINEIINKGLNHSSDTKQMILNHNYIIRNILENELSNNDEYPSPSLLQISKKSGYLELMLRKNQPDLCKLISKRHKETLAKYREEVRNSRVEEIRNVIMDMHLQGIRPTLERVKSSVPKNYFNRNGIGYNTWRETCIELGYL